MPDNSDKHEKEAGSRKNLIRILVIVGIGIPILVEVLTLFNLINVQFFEEEKKMIPHSQPASVRELVNGDTLLKEAPVPVILEDMLIKVSTREWYFELALSRSEISEGKISVLKVDSLKLNSGKILGGAREWKEVGHAQKTMGWQLPTGDIPSIVYVSTEQISAENSVQSFEQAVRLGNIPVRYRREE